ncbi:hypothetical protein AgCh_003786 [Apium graveolens]
MAYIRVLVSCAANLGWELQQLDVKNAFLHGDLKEEVYMDIPPGFSTATTIGKRVVVRFAYKQRNSDHTMFVKRKGEKITVLIVYVDDIVITGSDTCEIADVKQRLASEFEMKDLGKLRYLKAAPEKGVMFTNNKHLGVESYTYADWAGCLDDRRSTSGYCTSVGGNLVTWRSKKQPVVALVALSSAEAEYRAMARGVHELLWIRLFLTEVGLRSDTPMKLHCDNKSDIAIAHDPVQHDRTKHIEIDRHFIKENINNNVISIQFVRS